MFIMKTIGLIGGVSWYTTAVYYRLINELTMQRLGGANCARVILFSVNYNDFIGLQANDDWRAIESILRDIAGRLDTAGADCIVICANTPHLVASSVRQRLHIPLLHIAEVTAKEIARRGVRKVGLLGTRFTTEHSFFKDHLSQAGIEALIPDPAERHLIHSSIIHELTQGIFKEETRKDFIKIIRHMQELGAEGIVFCCTEISLLLRPEDCNMPVFDTTSIHAEAAVDFALNGAGHNS